MGSLHPTSFRSQMKKPHFGDRVKYANNTYTYGQTLPHDEILRYPLV